jgi:type IV secretion system protein VirD4
VVPATDTPLTDCVFRIVAPIDVVRTVTHSGATVPHGVTRTATSNARKRVATRVSDAHCARASAIDDSNRTILHRGFELQTIKGAFARAVKHRARKRAHSPLVVTQNDAPFALHNAHTSSAIYLGAGSEGWAWAQPQRSTLVLGPSRSGKTSALIVPNVLAAPGAVVSTSTKADVMSATARSRARQGATLLFDPSGTLSPSAPVERIGWSPITGCSDWDRALTMADAMVGSSRPPRAGVGAEDHWSERARTVLAPLLHAADIAQAPMATLLNWVERRNAAPGLGVLGSEPSASAVAVDALSSIVATDDREQSGIWSTASGVLSAYRSKGALDATEAPYLDPAAFCDGTHTLYVCASGARQQTLAPLVVGMLTTIRDAAYERAAHVAQPAVLFALDEVANIAPIPDLPGIVSEGAGQGLLTLACLQDLSQARRR